MRSEVQSDLIPDPKSYPILLVDIFVSFGDQTKNVFNALHTLSISMLFPSATMPILFAIWLTYSKGVIQNSKANLL